MIIAVTLDLMAVTIITIIIYIISSNFYGISDHHWDNSMFVMTNVLSYGFLALFPDYLMLIMSLWYTTKLNV